MKIESVTYYIHKHLAQNNLREARLIMEHNLKALSEPQNRKLLNLEALSLLKTVIEIQRDKPEQVLTREIQLIIQYINKSAVNFQVREVKKFAKMYEEQLKSGVVQNLLNGDARAILGFNNENMLRQVEVS